MDKVAEQKQLISDYKAVFASPGAAAVLADLRYWSGYETRIIPQDGPEMTAFQLGRRDMYLHIIDKIEADIEKLFQEKYEEPEQTLES